MTQMIDPKVFEDVRKDRDQWRNKAVALKHDNERLMAQLSDLRHQEQRQARQRSNDIWADFR